MRLILPLPLRRFLLGRLLFSVTMATAASGAEFVVDAAQATNPGQHVYNTLQELADSGALSSGDTVILHNDDSSLTSGLPVTVNFQSNDPDIFRTIDLAGLRTARGLYNDYAQPSRGEKLKLNSIILSNSRSRIIKPIHYSSQIGLDSISFGDGVRFVGNGFSSIDYCSGGVIDSFQQGSSYTFGDDVAFIGNYIVSSAGYASAAAVSISGSPFVFGDRAVFAGNYASSDSGDGWGGLFSPTSGLHLLWEPEPCLPATMFPAIQGAVMAALFFTRRWSSSSEMELCSPTTVLAVVMGRSLVGPCILKGISRR